MVTALVVVGVWALVASALAWKLHAESFIPGEKRTVLINFVQSDAGALRGVLFSRRGGYFTLKSVSLVSRDGSIVPIDGDVVVERDQISFLQVLPHR